MTTPTNAAPVAETLDVKSTDLVVAPKIREYASVLDAKTQEYIAERKRIAVIASEIAGQNWGKGLDLSMRQAVAGYLRAHAMDVTEINVLGGNLYRNSAYWLRRLSEMIEADKIEYARADHIHVDARLTEIAKGADAEFAARATAEITRRTFERVKYNAPDKAVAVVAFRVKLRGIDEEFVGVKWCGGGTQKKIAQGGAIVDGDPIGDLKPVETAETRSCRRCMRLIASQLPALKRIEDILDEAAEGVSLQIIAAHELAKNQREAMPALNTPLASAPANDPYDLGSVSAVPPAAVVDTALNAKLARHEALAGKKRRTDNEDAELSDLSDELRDVLHPQREPGEEG